MDHAMGNQPLVKLEHAELKRRIEAARVLRDITQADLERRFAEDGLDKKAAGRIERGNLTMRRSHLDAFVRHLRVPEAWFTADTVDDFIQTLGRDEIAERLDRIEDTLVENLGDDTRLATDVSRQVTQSVVDLLPDADESGRPGAGTRDAADASRAKAPAPARKTRPSGKRRAG